MPTASPSCPNKIWAGNHAGPVLIRRGGAIGREIRSRLVLVLLPSVGPVRWSGGASVPPAKTADFCGFRGTGSGLVATACRNSGPESADSCGFRADVPFMNNQRSASPTRAICAPAGPDRAARPGRGAAPLSGRARTPHAGRARVTSDFRPTFGLNAGCLTSDAGSGDAETVNLGLGSGVRGRADARLNARKARKSGLSGQFMAANGRVSAHKPLDPVAAAEAAPRRG